jgi:hypothetical protein
MNFKEFLCQEPPDKAKGFITRKGNITYGTEFPSAWISFRRINLEGSNRNSFWLVNVERWRSDRVQEALRIWALNMPEFYSDDVTVSQNGTALGKTTVENFANFNFKLN